MAKTRQKITAKPPRPAVIHTGTGDKGTADLEARAAALQAECRVRRGVTIESVTADLEQARQLAHEEGQAEAAVNACLGMAKLHGLLIDRTKVENDPTAGMTTEEIGGTLRHMEIEAVRHSGREYIIDRIAELKNLLAAFDAGKFEEYVNRDNEPTKH